MRAKSLIAFAVVVAAGIAAVVYANKEKEDPAAAHLAEGTRLWKDAVWHPERTRFGQAIAPLDRALKYGNNEPDLYFLLGTSVLFEAALIRNPAEATEAAASAVPLLKQLDALEPKHPGIFMARGLWEELRKQPTTAQLAFNTCVEALQPLAHDAPLREEIEFIARRGRANADTHLGTHGRAADDYAAIFDALERHGGQPMIGDYLGLANAHLRLRENPKALDVLGRALLRWPENRDLLLFHALMLADERADGAAAALRRALIAAPDNVTVLFKLAELARKDGELAQMRLRLAEARRLIDRLAPVTQRHVMKSRNAEHAGGLARYHLDLGNELRAAGDDAGADKAFRAALTHARDAAERWDACFRVHTIILRLGELIDVPERVLEKSRRARRVRHEQAPSLSDASRTFC